MKPVDVLNQAFAKDPAALRALVINRVPCNQSLADDEFIPVDTDENLEGAYFNVGMMGLINGILKASGQPLVASKWQMDDFGPNIFQGFCEYTNNPKPYEESDAYPVAKCYNIISKYYGDKCAKRSGVRYMNHIDEGMQILDRINASTVAFCAYCLHPILQDDETLEANMELVKDVDYKTLTTVMEYRNVANRGLSCYQVDNPEHIYLGPLKDVHDMLVADKVQNRKDFLKYHLDTHPKSKELDRYFRNWLRALNITEAKYAELIEDL